MDITLLMSFFAFWGMVAAWVMLPTGENKIETSGQAVPVVQSSKA